VTLPLAPFLVHVATGATPPAYHPPAIAENRSGALVWAVSRVAVAGLVGSMTLGVVSTATGTALLSDARTATPQIEQGLHSLAQAAPAVPVALGTSRTADRVNKLHAQSGLTWDQIGRLLGVSRRAVHMWAAGKRMNARNTELLADLIHLVDSATGGTPDERRSWLFTATVSGMTPVERFLSQHRQPGHPLSGSGYTPAELLGISTE